MMPNNRAAWEIQYLTKEHLDGFDSYKVLVRFTREFYCACWLLLALALLYNAVDTNPLSIYVMHPFWNQVVKICPRWVAPNVLTFVGFLFTCAAFLLLSYYDLNFSASDRDHPEVLPIPNWVFLFTSITVFIAYTLDGIDGKQARRTQTCGPMGELFDHGLDSWTSVLIPVSLYSVFGRGEHSISTMRLYFVLWNVFINFYLSHWEKYNTGVLVLPWGYDISMLFTVVLFLITGTWGYEIWKFDLWFGISAGNLVELFFYLSAIFWNIPVVLSNIYKSYRDGTGKMLSTWEALRPLFPVVLCASIGSLWALCDRDGVISTNPRWLYFMTGTLFSNICCRLIVSQMSSTRCDGFNWLLAPLTGAALLSVFTSINKQAILYALTALVTLAHIHYGACVGPISVNYIESCRNLALVTSCMVVTVINFPQRLLQFMEN